MPMGMLYTRPRRDNNGDRFAYRLRDAVGPALGGPEVLLCLLVNPAHPRHVLSRGGNRALDAGAYPLRYVLGFARFGLFGGDLAERSVGPLLLFHSMLCTVLFFDTLLSVFWEQTFHLSQDSGGW